MPAMPHSRTQASCAPLVEAGKGHRTESGQEDKDVSKLRLRITWKVIPATGSFRGKLATTGNESVRHEKKKKDQSRVVDRSGQHEVRCARGISDQLDAATGEWVVSDPSSHEFQLCEEISIHHRHLIYDQNLAFFPSPTGLAAPRPATTSRSSFRSHHSSILVPLFACLAAPFVHECCQILVHSYHHSFQLILDCPCLTSRSKITLS